VNYLPWAFPVGFLVIALGLFLSSLRSGDFSQEVMRIVFSLAVYNLAAFALLSRFSRGGLLGRSLLTAGIAIGFLVILLLFSVGSSAYGMSISDTYVFPAATVEKLTHWALRLCRR